MCSGCTCADANPEQTATTLAEWYLHLECLCYAMQVHAAQMLKRRAYASDI